MLYYREAFPLVIQGILGGGLEGTLKIMQFQTPVVRNDLFCLNVKEQ